MSSAILERAPLGATGFGTSGMSMPAQASPGAGSFCVVPRCTMNGICVCQCNLACGMCTCEYTKDGVCITCKSGDKACCEMIQACCDCLSKCLDSGCCCYVSFHNTPVCCGCC